MYRHLKEQKLALFTSLEKEEFWRPVFKDSSREIFDVSGLKRLSNVLFCKVMLGNLFITNLEETPCAAIVSHVQYIYL